MATTAKDKSHQMDMTGLAVLADDVVVNNLFVNGTTTLGNGSYVAAGATKTLTAAANSGQLVKLDTAAGSVVTLPAATGSGVKFRFLVTVLATSNSHIVKVANASDTMIGIIFSMDDTAAAAVAFAAGATADTITLNRGTTGSVTLGEWLQVEDVAANLWFVHGFVTNTGTPATQFSATV